MTTTLDRIHSYEKTERQQLLTDLRAGKSPTFHTFGHTKGVTSKSSVDVVLSEEIEDRMGDVIQIGGWHLAEYRKNNILLWNHDPSLLPIGNVTGIHTSGKQLLGTLRFDMSDVFAESIAQKFQSKVLNAVSVGFRPLAFHQASNGRGLIFEKVELLEVSAVSIPALPSALAKVYAGGLLLNVKEDKPVLGSYEERKLQEYFCWVLFGNNGESQRAIISLSIQGTEALNNGSTDSAMRIARSISALIAHNSGDSRVLYPSWMVG